MSKPSSPFTANPKRYRNVPNRVKNPRTQSGCLSVSSAIALALTTFILSVVAWVT